MATLSPDLRPNFEFVWAIAVDQLADNRTRRLRAFIEDIAAGYDFKTSVKIYELSDLEKEFPIR